MKILMSSNLTLNFDIKIWSWTLYSQVDPLIYLKPTILDGAGGERKNVKIENWLRWMWREYRRDQWSPIDSRYVDRSHRKL